MDRAKLGIPRYAQIDSKQNIAAAAKIVGFPAFLKPVYGVQVSSISS